MPYYEDDSESPAISAMATTLLLNDNSVDDQSTGHTGTVTEVFNNICPAPVEVVDSYQSGAYGDGNRYNFTALRFTYKGVRRAGGLETQCGADEDTPTQILTCTWTIKKSEDGTSWVDVATGTVDADNTFRSQAYSTPFEGKYLMVTIHTHLAEPLIAQGTRHMDAILTDLRLSGTLLEEEGGGGGGEDDDSGNDTEADHDTLTTVPFLDTATWERDCGPEAGEWGRSCP